MAVGRVAADAFIAYNRGGEINLRKLEMRGRGRCRFAH